VHVSVTAARSHLVLDDLRLGSAPTGSGCTG
jgi:hypothetical protein